MSETPIEQFIISVNNMRSELEKALDEKKSGVNVDKFISVLIFYIKKNIKLLDNDRQSLVDAYREAASEGLLVDGREGYISPYKGMLKFGAMTAGVVKKLGLAGINVNPQVVCKNDKFEYWTDEEGQHIKHAPDPFASKEVRGELIGVYSIAKTSDGFIHIEIMSKDEIEKVRSKSSNKTGLMWTEFYDEGCKKSVIRRGYKWLPKNSKLDDFFKKEDEEFEFDKEVTSDKPARITSRVEEIINNKNAGDKPIVHTESSPVFEPKEEIIPPSSTGPRLAKEESEIVEGLMVKIGIIGADTKKPRYCLKISDETYGTDLKAMYDDAIIPLFEQKIPIRVSFIKGENSNGTFRDIIKIEKIEIEKPKTTKRELPL